MEKKKYKYKGKEEMKVKKTLALHQSVIDAVEERQKEQGGKISALVENLLIGWCQRHDKIKELEEKYKSELID